MVDREMVFRHLSIARPRQAHRRRLRPCRRQAEAPRRSRGGEGRRSRSLGEPDDDRALRGCDLDLVAELPVDDWLVGLHPPTGRPRATKPRCGLTRCGPDRRSSCLPRTSSRPVELKPYLARLQASGIRDVRVDQRPGRRSIGRGPVHSRYFSLSRATSITSRSDVPVPRAVATPTRYAASGAFVLSPLWCAASRASSRSASMSAGESERSPQCGSSRSRRRCACSSQSSMC